VRPAAIHHRGAQVSQDAARILDLVPVPVQAEERVLHDVLRRGAVTGKQQREPHQPERVLPVQILDPRLRGSPHAPYDAQASEMLHATARIDAETAGPKERSTRAVPQAAVSRSPPRSNIAGLC
jgi:hypothetical protein